MMGKAGGTSAEGRIGDQEKEMNGVMTPMRNRVSSKVLRLDLTSARPPADPEVAMTRTVRTTVGSMDDGDRAQRTAVELVAEDQMMAMVMVMGGSAVGEAQVTEDLPEAMVDRRMTVVDQTGMASFKMDRSSIQTIRTGR